MDEANMTPKAKGALVPALRFPEFRDAGEWSKQPLGKLADIVASGDLNTLYFSPNATDQHIYPVYSNSVDKEGLYGYYTLPKYPKDSVTVTARGTLGVAFLRRQEFMGIGRLLIISNLVNLNPYFLKECWNHLASIPQEVTSIPQLTAIAARAIMLPVPYPSEQQKIADCLSSIDELITLEARKIDALKAHKKGLMQQLFPAEGETLPELRFPEFQDAGEWEEKTLSEACRVTQGGTPDTAATDLWGGSIQWLTPAEMEKGDSKYIAKTVRSITEKGLSNCSSELLPVNSVIISTRAPIGHLAINKEPMAINQGCRGLIPKTSFDAHFIYYFLAKSKTQLNDLGSGNTFKEISGKTLKEFLIAFPMLAEQQKIADCLSSIDNLITLEARKIDALKTHKKGLLQQLFPSLDEVRR